MNFLLRLIPLPIGFGVAYLIGNNISNLDKATKFVIASMSMICLGYFFTWFNLQIMRKNGEFPKNKLFKQKLPGYVFLLLGAFIMGYGFSANKQLFLLAGFVFWWVSDDLLTKQA